VSVSGGSPVSFFWELGDGNTSTSPNNILYTYTGYMNTGSRKYAPRVTVQFSNGSTCVALSDSITIYRLPNVDFSIGSDDTLCFEKNELVIRDLSTPSVSSVPLFRRILQLNNGHTQIQFYPTTPFIKYKNTLDVTGRLYDIVLEVTDTNGCVNRASKMDSVLLLPQNPPTSFIFNMSPGCDSSQVLFLNTTNVPRLMVKSFVWKFGDSTESFSSWDSAMKYYRIFGTHSPELFWTDTNNCQNSYTATDAIVHYKIDSLITIIPRAEDTTRRYCYKNQVFDFINNSPGFIKNWYIIKDGKKIDSTSGSLWQNYTFPTCGYYTIRVESEWAGCRTVIDSGINILGPKSIIDIQDNKVLNRYQCEIHDTVYFLNPLPYFSCHNQNYSMKHLWDFNDPYAPACTTNTQRQININMNCRYSMDSTNVKHRFLDGKEGCYKVSLYLKDTVLGCEDISYVNVSLEPPKASPSVNRRGVYYLGNACLNRSIRFMFDSIANDCGVEQIHINWDTACGNQWQHITTYDSLPFYDYTYIRTCNTTGLVVVGVVMRNGKDKNGNYCYDTAYYPFFNFGYVSSEFTHKKISCNPTVIELQLKDTTMTGIDYVKWELYKINMYFPTLILEHLFDTTWFLSGVVPTHHKQYFHIPDAGSFMFRMYIKDTNGCILVSEQVFVHGFSGIFSTEKPSYCVNAPLVLKDFVRYFDYRYPLTLLETNFWDMPDRNSGGKENLWWDIGDGNGFVYEGANPTVSYKKPGVYTITLMIKDSLQCFDTIELKDFITITQVKPVSWTVDSLLFCAPQIAGFRDSSYFIDSLNNRIPMPLDSVTNWYWDFGDNKQSRRLRDPAHYYTSNGEFDVKMVVQTVSGCIDSAITRVVISGPKPLFVLTDTIGCAPFEATFVNSTNKQLLNWTWYFGDLDSSIFATNLKSDVKYTYKNPGTYYVRLLGVDTVFNTITQNTMTCNAYFPDTALGMREMKVIVLPVPKMTLIAPDTICPNEPFVLIADGSSIYNSYLWKLGILDSVITTRPDTFTRFQFSDTGFYNIGLYPQSGDTLVCMDNVFKTIYVFGPNADFDIEKGDDSNYKLINNSRRANQFKWFDNKNIVSANPFSIDKDPTYYFSGDSIVFNICLQAISNEGCIDTMCKEVSHYSMVKIPNVFTPGNEDGLNDVFDVDIIGETKYELQIFNRWGSLVFESKTDGNGNDGNNWNGKVNNKGEDCSAGVYYYVFKFQLLNHEEKGVNGTITLIR
jgi:gliding motility-associated-like protein